jgi:hypothetical protein
MCYIVAELNILKLSHNRVRTLSPVASCLELVEVRKNIISRGEQESVAPSIFRLWNKTKQNETKQNKTKQNKTKQNETKQNETKQNETKQNETKQNETKWKDVHVRYFAWFPKGAESSS